MVIVIVSVRVSPDTRVGGDGMADSNGITPRLITAAPKTASFWIVDVPVAVYR
jgi:hypothetical protein